MVVSKHLTHFCYPIKLVLHQHLNSHVAYPDITRSLYCDQSLRKLVHQKEDSQLKKGRMGVGRDYWSNLLF